MASRTEKSQLKRALQPSQPSHGESEIKKPRRSQRIQDSEGHTPIKTKQLPSPMTHRESTTATDDYHTRSITPPSQRHDDAGRLTNALASPVGLSSPPSDTQAFSQFVYPPKNVSYEVQDEEGEGVWGYLIPLDHKSGGPLVLRQRSACPAPETKKAFSKDHEKRKHSKKGLEKEEEEYEEKKLDGIVAGGYLLGRHPECDRQIHSATVSNRHCLIFTERKGGKPIAVIEDLSVNGTYVNDAIIGRDKRRELFNGDEISILDQARFLFKYPRSRSHNGFADQYSLREKLGKGHFASVYLCIEKNSGSQYAVKIFEKRTGPGERSKVDGLQQEIAVLMSISHPALLCLKDTFDEDDGVYLVLELAPEGELFNWIVMKQKLTEAEARKVFIQLFQSVKYLHERNIVHRDIKPENILLTDTDLNIKLADFGLAKIIGEESFTTTLCGTPSYVAPEILEPSGHRRYTRAVDVWSLGVVLYICLCGFPPFSDELYSRENPYTLSQQIKMGRFDFPSPYWDSVGDPALDLIDRMLTVDVEKRITIDECLEHPWTTERPVSLTDSTDGLTGAMQHLDFSKRKPHRERTLLAEINDVHVSKVIETEADPVKVFEKNENRKNKNKQKNGKELKEIDPSANRAPQEFIELGGKGDVTLFADDSTSKYTPSPEPKSAKNGKKGKK